MACDHVFDISLWQKPTRAFTYKMNLMNDGARQILFLQAWRGVFIGVGVLYSFALSLPLSNPTERAQEKSIYLVRRKRVFVFIFNPRNIDLQISKRELPGHLVQISTPSRKSHYPGHAIRF